MAHPPWTTGDIIQPRFLNALQELLSDWSDNVLLQATGAAVVVPGASSAPAELVIEGLMRISATSHAAVISGAAGTYDVWAYTTKGSNSFAVAATPTAPNAPYTKLLGTAEFNGSQVTEVHSALREVNVSHLYGSPPSETSTGHAIPAGRSDGTLDPAWLSNLDAGLVPVGGIREVWVPSGVSYTPPTGWRLMDGSTVGAASHAFPGVGAFTLPDMRNRMSLGANPAAVYGTPGNDSGVAPGLNGQGGDMTVRSTTHNHTVDAHAHTVGAHSHNANHSHVFKPHYHGFSGDWHTKYRALADPVVQSALIRQAVTDAVEAPLSAAAPAVGNAAPGTQNGGGAVATAVPAAADLRPWNLGLVSVMRVM